MAKNFKKISSFENLKEQYKVLLKKNHPDNGGDTAKMQEINAEYDALFKIWKDRHESETDENGRAKDITVADIVAIYHGQRTLYRAS